MVSTISRGEKILMRSTDLAEVRRAENSPIYSCLLTILALTHTDFHNGHMYTHSNDLNDQPLHLLITKASSLSLFLFLGLSVYGEIPASYYGGKKERAE